MADPTTQSTKAPWHLWVVGGIAGLWNCDGAMDFTLTQVGHTAYLSALTPRQLAYLNSFPVWVVVAWGIATWGGVVGSLLLLCRRSLAVCVFLVSLIGVVLTDLHNYVLSNGREIIGGGAGAVVFAAVIFVIAVLLWVYARVLRKRGVLR